MMTTELGRRLWAEFETVADPRPQLGRRHPLAAILSLTLAAMLSRAQSLCAIAQ